MIHVPVAHRYTQEDDVTMDTRNNPTPWKEVAQGQCSGPGKEEFVKVR